MIVFVVALLGTWVVYRSVQIYSPYPLLSMLIYFGHGFLNREMVQMQSGLAIAITLYAIRFITERKPLQYYGLVVLACTIHVVAFIMLPMYVICRIRYTTSWILILFLVSLTLATVDWVHPALDFGVAIGIIPELVSVYLRWPKYDYALGILNNLASIKHLLIFSLLIVFREQLEERFSYFRELFLIYAVATFWLISFQHMAILAARLATVMAFGEIVLIAMLVNLVRERTAAFGLAALLALMSLYGNLFLKSSWRLRTAVTN